MMKRIYFLMSIILVLSFSVLIKAQSKSYLDLNEQEKSEYVAAKIDEITVKISGKKYAFDEDFQLRVSNALDSYAKRVGNGIKSNRFGQDLIFVLLRGSEVAPIINKQFDKNGISRLSGLYIAMIESEFISNISSPTGNYGIFQVSSPRAKKYVLPIKERANVEKSADLTARYLIESQKSFASNNMKEFLAILSWNREVRKINFDISFKFMDESKYRACAICGLTEYPNRFDQQFQTESVKYIPKFLAAAIIGENPSDFGLITEPLSSY